MRVERWNVRAIAVWMIVQKQLMCVISVYGPQTGRTEAEKQDFRDEVGKMMGLVEVGTMSVWQEIVMPMWVWQRKGTRRALVDIDGELGIETART